MEPRPPVTPDSQAIEKGRRPLASRRKEISALRARALELYGLPPSGLAPLTAIDAQFRFSPVDSDKGANHLPIEALLEQANILLRRCAETRSEYDRLQREKFLWQLELDRFLALDGLHERERRAGEDTLGYERAIRDGAAERSLAVDYKGAEAQLKALTDDLMASGFNRRMAARELSAWISAYPLKDADLRGDDANYTFDGVHKSKPDHLFDAARLEADEAAWEQAVDLMARRYAATAESEAARLRGESLGLQTEWALADIDFRSERAKVERDGFWEKVFQAQSPGSPLNYVERLEPLGQRFTHDFREAVACLTAAQRSFQELYGDSLPLPAEGTPGYFDAVVSWAGEAQSRMARFSQREQIYVLALSLKNLSPAQWEAGRAGSQWTFDVPEGLFEGQANVRLRGVGLAVVPAEEPPETQKPKGSKPETAKAAGYWTARLFAPPKATVRHAAGSLAEVDQSALPPCYLGRVGREPEIVAASPWRNASPIGQQWRLNLSSKSTSGTAAAMLQDVELHLRLAVL
jgi:hypothetical protein